jgi:hypothetical protein
VKENEMVRAYGTLRGRRGRHAGLCFGGIATRKEISRKK